MEKPPEIEIPESASADELNNAKIERKFKLDLLKNKTYRNLLTFLRIMMDVACKNQQLLSSKYYWATYLRKKILFDWISSLPKHLIFFYFLRIGSMPIKTNADKDECPPQSNGFFIHVYGGHVENFNFPAEKTNKN